MNSYYNITKASYSANYEDFIEQWKDSNIVNPAKIDYFISLLPQGAKVLDVGAGFGKDVHYLNLHGIETVGVDNCKEFIKQSKALYSNVEIYESDFVSMEFNDEEFDGIWSRGSLFHISKKDFKFVINKLRKYSKNNSIFYILMKEGRGELVKNIGDTEYKAFYALYEKNELEGIFAEFGYELIKDERHEKWISQYYKLHK